MNEFGCNFTENVFTQILNIIDNKIPDKNPELMNFYRKKLKESFKLFKMDKNELEKIFANTENQAFFTIEEMDILNKAIYIKIF